MKPKPFEIIVEFTPQSNKTGITYEAHQKGSLIRCKDCKYNPKLSWTGCPMAGCMSRTDEWYCPKAERKETEQ
jgi:hypothetical protein